MPPSLATRVPPVEDRRRPAATACARARVESRWPPRRRSAGRPASPARAGRRSAGWHRPWPGGRSGPSATSSCTSRRRRVVQRWPQVPTAEKAMARTAMSRSASGRHDHGVVAAQLQQAAAQTAGDRLGHGAAHPGGAGGGDQRHARIGGQGLAGLAPADQNLGQVRRGIGPNRARARSNMAWVARAVSGVFSDGFQITGSPQTRASAAFQAQTATGKLKARDDPDRPQRLPGLAHVMAGAFGRHGQAVEAGATGRRRSRRCRSSPAPRPGPRRRSCRPRG